MINHDKSLKSMKFDDIDESTIESLINRRATESINLEFKRKLRDTKEGEKKLRKTICAFANVRGGDLVIGLEENNGFASKMSPIPLEEFDDEMLWLETVAHTNFEPTIGGLKVKHILCNNSTGIVFLVRVPQSDKLPHCVNFGEYSQYYIRRNSLSVKANQEELRLMFTQKTTQEERAKLSIDQRFSNIKENNVPIELKNPGNAIILHLVPLNHLDSEKEENIMKLNRTPDQIGLFLSSTGRSHPNIDGMIRYKQFNEFHSYTQIFRNGTIESVTDIFANTGQSINSNDIVSWFDTLISSHLSLLQFLKISTPILINISFLGMEGTKLDVENAIPCTLDTIHLKHSFVQDYQDGHNSCLKILMDHLWNTFGLVECELL